MRRFKKGEFIKFKGYPLHVGRIVRVKKNRDGLLYRVWCKHSFAMLTWDESQVEDATLEAMADV